MPLLLLVILLASVTDTLRQSIVNTLILGIGANLIALPLGITIGCVCRNSGVLPYLARVICLAFLFVPMFVHVSAWDSAIGKLGWLTNAQWSISSVPAGNWMLAIWIHGLAAIPIVSVVVWFGLSGSIRIHEEQAALDASPQKVFWFVTLPRIVPILGVCAVWVFVTCSREIAVTDIYRIGTLAEQIYLGYSLGETQTMLGAGFAMSSMGIIGTMIAIIIVPYFNEQLSSNEQLVGSRRGGRNSLLQNGWAACILSSLFVVPAFNVIARASRYVENVQQVPVARHSLENLVQVVGQVPTVFASEACWSFLIAIASSGLIVTSSVLLVWFAFEYKLARWFLLGTFLISCSLPGPVIGSLLLYLRSVGSWDVWYWLFDRTIFAPVVANTLFCFPMSLIFVWFVLRNTSADAMEHAKLEGAGFWVRLFSLALAGNIKALIGVGLITFASCMGELSASQLVVPPGIDTIPRRMLGLLHSGVNDHTAGLTIVSFLLIIGIVTIGYGFVNWNQTRREQ